jgi:hypothetical protein
VVIIWSVLIVATLASPIFIDKYLGYKQPKKPLRSCFSWNQINQKMLRLGYKKANKDVDCVKHIIKGKTKPADKVYWVKLEIPKQENNNE